MENEILNLPGNAIFLNGTKTLITFSAAAETKQLFSDPHRMPVQRTIGKKTYEIVPWGNDNNLPHKIAEKVYGAEVVASNVLFNIETGYGQGIVPVKFETNAQGVRIPRPFYDNKEINAFLEENDISNFLLEQLTDMKMFYNVFPEIILSKDGKKITNIYSKEAEFSRWEKMDEEGVIRHHFYSACWNGHSGSASVEDLDPIVTPVLDNRFPYRDLVTRMESKSKDRRFIIPVSFPTPGRQYYQKPYWWSIFESGWYDYMTMIPKYKKKIISELSVIRYHIELKDDYFEQIFKKEGITDKEKKEARIKEEYDNLNKFLSDNNNTNKSVISYVSYSPDGKEMSRMKINKIDDNVKGGEFIEDSEEASNIICYAMGVHPSLIGASPGKSKTINGTEARELFLIKQTLERPFRDRLLMPLHLIKRYNGWPDDIYFYIPDITLTTLDKSSNGTAQVKTEI